MDGVKVEVVEARQAVRVVELVVVVKAAVVRVEASKAAELWAALMEEMKEEVVTEVAPRVVEEATVEVVMAAVERVEE